MPLARIDEKNPRLNLALARTNCVSQVSAAARSAAPRPGEVLFYAELVSKRETGSAPSASLPELKRALERWGYVREK
jgi:hypothetical protein